MVKTIGANVNKPNNAVLRSLYLLTWTDRLAQYGAQLGQVIVAADVVDMLG